MSLLHPFQKLCIAPSHASRGQVLLAASGPRVSVLSLESGTAIASWPSFDDEDAGSSEPEQPETPNKNDLERPRKRQKLETKSTPLLSTQTSDLSDVSVEIVAERKKGERRRPKSVQSKTPNISHLLTTSDGKYVIVVTAEDKSVKVFELRSSGRLKLSSERALPKRLCAIQLSTDERTILTADKFGDVYAVPLLATPDWIAKENPTIKKGTFSPAATELTVHTKGNLAALKQQREQRNVKPRKEGPKFEHQLLLGHVSLLTDLAVAIGSVDGRDRPFILTADRDEHIRVSRGVPQTHIIESYCLGHQDFISKLCLIPWAADLLVAGDGEPSLRVFRWQRGVLVQELPLNTLDSALSRPDLLHSGRSIEKLTVSGIWPIKFDHDTILPGILKTRGVLVIALEGLPVLQTYYLGAKDQLQFLNSLTTPGNVLDVAQISSAPEIIVSLDTIHQAGSMCEVAPGQTHQVEALKAFRLTPSRQIDAQGESTRRIPPDVIRWQPCENAIANGNIGDCLAEISDAGQANTRTGRDNGHLYSALGEFLYGLENLRKKPGIAAAAEEEDDEVAQNGDENVKDDA